MQIGTLTAELRAEYARFRMANIQREGQTGRRAIDIELSACAQLFGWAIYKGRASTNPFSGRKPLKTTERIIHCSERAPRNADEVHRVAKVLLSDLRSESTGWLFLFLCLTGARTVEMRTLPFNPPQVGQTRSPGWTDGHQIVITRAKIREGRPNSDIITLSEPAAELLAAWRLWHATRHPGSSWWFPGRDPASHLDAGALAHALKRVCPALGIPAFTPHGCRSYFCSTLRASEPDDRVVADRLGHRDVAMLQRIYGRRMQDCTGLTWVPEDGPPAWHAWRPDPVLLALPAAG
jgi:integrase